jgi:protein-disulfide isomerase-like protein with CxxC motif
MSFIFHKYALQGSQSAMLQGLNCADRLFEGTGDFFVLQTLKEFQHDHLSLVGRKLQQGLTNTLTAQSLHGSLEKIFFLSVQVGVERRFYGEGTSIAVSDPVMGDAIQVGLQVLTRTFPIAQGRQEAREGLADTFLGRVNITQQPYGIAIQSGAVEVVDMRERLWLELPGTLQQVVFRIHVGFHKL